MMMLFTGSLELLAIFSLIFSLRLKNTMSFKGPLTWALPYAVVRPKKEEKINKNHFQVFQEAARNIVYVRGGGKALCCLPLCPTVTPACKVNLESALVTAEPKGHAPTSWDILSIIFSKHTLFKKLKSAAHKAVEATESVQPSPPTFPST